MKLAASVVLGATLLAIGCPADTTQAESIVNSVSLHGIELQVIRQADPWDGLESYRVKAVSSAGLLNTMSFFRPAVQGETHQCEYRGDGTPQSTVFLGEIRAGEAGDPSWTDSGWTDVHTACDTHVLMSDAMNHLIQFGNDRLVEVNDGSNPYGLDASDGAVKAGMGQMTGGTDHTICILGATGQTLEMDLMQIVIPEGSEVFFSGRILGAFVDPVTFENVSIVDFESVSICAAPVPEPSTLVLLGAGVVSLLGARLRRK